MIPAGQRAELFSNEANVLFIRNTVWMLSTVLAASETKMPTERPSIWEVTVDLWQTSLPAVPLVSPKAELDHAGYASLHGMADLLIATPCKHRAAR